MLIYLSYFSDVYKINVVPRKTYMLRLIGALLHMECFFSIANHKLTIVEADGEYTKPLTTDHVMLGPGQTLIVLVTTDQKIGRYSMAMGPYMSGQNVTIQNITAIAYFQYFGASPHSVALPASLLPRFDDNLAVKTVMDGLKSLEVGNVPKEIDTNLFFTIGFNVNKCNSKTPKQNCRGSNGGVMAASMNNNRSPLKFYDFVNGPNSAPNDTGSTNGTRTKVIEYGSRVQLILQDTGTVTTENHPIHFHGYSFYVVGYGSGNYNPQTATFNLVDPPYMNTIGVPVGGWAAIRFVADNPGVWFMHCHLEVHMTWGLGVALIVKNGQGPMETLPHPPADMPRC
ncbi:putative laccase [Helianthus annuus]|nr:putative laccase [Helianthus annuus]